MVCIESPFRPRQPCLLNLPKSQHIEQLAIDSPEQRFRRHLSPSIPHPTIQRKKFNFPKMSHSMYLLTYIAVSLDDGRHQNMDKLKICSALYLLTVLQRIKYDKQSNYIMLHSATLSNILPLS